MSKLAADLAKHGLEAKKKDKKSSSSLEIVMPDKKTKLAIEQYLNGQEKLAEATAMVNMAADEIRNFAIDNSLKIKSMDNILMNGDNGAVSVIFKDQYSIKDIDAARQTLKDHKMDASEYISESSSLKFDYDKLTDGERKKLLTFLTKELGTERFAQVVSEETKYSIKGLVEELPSVAKNREDLDDMRAALGHYNPTVAVYKGKK